MQECSFAPNLVTKKKKKTLSQNRVPYGNQGQNQYHPGSGVIEEQYNEGSGEDEYGQEEPIDGERVRPVH